MVVMPKDLSIVLRWILTIERPNRINFETIVAFVLGMLKL